MSKGTNEVYSDGVYLQPRNVGGVWVWIAVDFDEGAYNDKGEHFSPLVEAETLEELINE